MSILPYPQPLPELPGEPSGKQVILLAFQGASDAASPERLSVRPRRPAASSPARSPWTGARGARGPRPGRTAASPAGGQTCRPAARGIPGRRVRPGRAPAEGAHMDSGRSSTSSTVNWLTASFGETTWPWLTCEFPTWITAPPDAPSSGCRPTSPASTVSPGAAVPADLPARAISREKLDEWRLEAAAAPGFRAEVRQDEGSGRQRSHRRFMLASYVKDMYLVSSGADGRSPRWRASTPNSADSSRTPGRTPDTWH
jgi:hypothetical protein